MHRGGAQMIGTGGKDAGAVGGKAARACDSCMRRRARWYCAADDAFLCQTCDTSVHSANPLARRHERVRLRASSSPSMSPPVEGVAAAAAAAATTTTTSKRLGVAPAWLKRKARTRRPPVKSVGQLLSRRLVVPEVGSAGDSSEERKEEDEQLLYRVPIFDPTLGEFFSPPPIDDAVITASGFMEEVDGAVENSKEPPLVAPSPVQELPNGCGHYGPTDAELREFAADMEALLGQGLDDSNELEDSFYMEALGLITQAGDCGRVKVEADDVISRNRGALPASGAELNYSGTSTGEVLDKDFNCSSHLQSMVDDQDDGFDHKTSSASNSDAAADAHFLQGSLDLRLNYETIIEKWGSSPWTDGRRPHVPLDDFLLHDHHHSGMWTAGARLGGAHGEPSAGTAPAPKMDGWREARVSRYREKRRTRLFAKKIRYEVRKLNAEKRPRMKGRFVKRPTAAAAPCAVT